MTSMIDTANLEPLERADVRRGNWPDLARQVAEARRQFLAGRDSVGPFLRQHGVDTRELDRLRAQRPPSRPTPPPAPALAGDVAEARRLLGAIKQLMDTAPRASTPAPAKRATPRPPTVADLRAETDNLRAWAARHQPKPPKAHVIPGVGVAVETRPPRTRFFIPR